ncbi:MAG: ABC transporter ATP-binding protein [Alphaproteobacteria bacterium]|nr:ABC transporter ATP-binding protein [Alphaproteobacteria bacterium]
MTGRALEVNGLTAGYGGGGRAIEEVTFSIPEGGALALIGPNGSGKSTTMKTIAGLLAPLAGDIRYGGQPIGGLAPERIARLGVAYVPEDRRMFADLTVRENLAIARRGDGGGRWPEEALFDLFPNLAEIAGRSAGATSGGEQQMIAIARALAGEPDLLMLDEPSEGLAPKIVENLAAAMERLRRDGITLLISEQNPALLGRVVEDCVVLSGGTIRWTGPLAGLRES